MAAPEDGDFARVPSLLALSLELSVAVSPPGTIIEHTVDVNERPETS